MKRNFFDRLFDARYERLGPQNSNYHALRTSLSTDLEWEWRNPLNVFPLMVLGATAMAVVGLLLKAM